jgi:HD-like signal output (HDOD) protein
VAYVTGLLHNIGILLMRHLFQTEFEWLNKMLSNRPEQGLITTEQNLFGCTHTTIGKYVMQHWNMPEEISQVVAEHHTPEYTGPQATYVWLSQLAGQALKPYGLSDSNDETISENLCRQLELKRADVDAALEIVLEESKALNAMADTLCA